jgi:hypothetical protein
MAQHASYAPSDPATVTVAVDEVRRIQPLILSRGGTIVCTVKEQGGPKPGIMVQLMSSGPIQQGMTDSAGRARFEGIKPGEYLLNLVDMAAMQKGTMAIKTRAVTVEGEEEVEIEVVYGVGRTVHGTITGLPPGPMRMVTLRRPGGPAPEDLNPLDTDASIEAAKYQAGMGMIRADGTYEITDLEPGTYILEIPKMPSNPTDLDAYAKMDRTPYDRREVTVKEGEDLSLDITVE